jgi:hypothetical protein
LDRLLVHADHRSRWIKGTFVHAQHVFHAGHVVAVVIGRDDPRYLAMGLQIPFFRTLRTVS